MRISTTILFVSLATLLAIATTYTIRRSQSNELPILNIGDDSCLKIVLKPVGGGFSASGDVYAQNICEESQEFYYRSNINGQFFSTACLKKGEEAYTFSSRDFDDYSRFASNPCVI